MIQITHLTKKYCKETILNSVSLSVKKGDIVGVIGPSGSGKSTLLRCIAGIETYDSGEIEMEKDCRIGMVFQNFNIFNNMSVIQNLCYPQIKVLNRTREEAQGISMQMLKKVNMVHLFDRHSSELSGGQKQRVAIARTLCMDSSVILFDEPTSALDPENVMEILDLIKSIASDEMSMMIVSHEIRFVKSIATKMLFMDHGKIIVNADKNDFFNAQKDERVMTFLESLLSH